jgi:uncharacterized protein (DUF1800 family)
MKLKRKYQYSVGGDYSSIRVQLTNMGQTLLEPGSVLGWDWESAWISSATLLARYNFARNRMAGTGLPRQIVESSFLSPKCRIKALP